MNLTSKAKDEAAIEAESDCCNTALLSALIHSAGSISFTSEGVGVYLSSENKATVSLAAALIEKLYGAHIDPNKNELEIRGDFVPEMLFDLGILTYDGDKIGAFAGISGFVANKECCIRNYLKGVFLGAGSVSIGKKYHLEMAFSTQEMAEDVCALAESFSIVAHIVGRKDKFVVYIKSVESISDFLALIGANKAVLELNNTAALRNVNMNANRRANCDIANVDRVVETSLKQTEAINKIMDLLIDPKLIEVASARIANPDASYQTLAELLGVSKGCIKYRLKKIMDYSLKEVLK